TIDEKEGRLAASAICLMSRPSSDFQREVHDLLFAFDDSDVLGDHTGLQMAGFEGVFPRRQAGRKMKVPVFIRDREERMLQDSDVTEFPRVNVAFEPDKDFRSGKAPPDAGRPPRPAKLDQLAHDR